MRLQQYIIEEQRQLVIESMTYEEYLGYLDMSLDEGIVDSIKNIGLSIVSKFKEDFQDLLDDVHYSFLTAEHLVLALKNKDVFYLLKTIGFSLKTIIKGFHLIPTLIRNGLDEIFKELHDSKMIQQLKKGVIKADDLLDKYPMLKKVSGPVVAALLLWIWLNMSFTSHPATDFDFSHITAALKGSFTLADLFVSPEGLMMLGLLGTGSLLSFTWLSSSMANVMVALIYTGLKKSKKATDITSKIKENMVFKRV